MKKILTILTLSLVALIFSCGKGNPVHDAEITFSNTPTGVTTWKYTLEKTDGGFESGATSKEKAITIDQNKLKLTNLSEGKWKICLKGYGSNGEIVDKNEYAIDFVVKIDSETGEVENPSIDFKDYGSNFNDGDDASFKKDFGDTNNWTETTIEIGDNKLRVLKFEVPNEVYRYVMGTNVVPSRTSAANDNPLENISVYEAMVLCNKLSHIFSDTTSYDTCVYKIVPEKEENGTDPIADVDKWGDIPTQQDDRWDAVEIDTTKTGFRLPTSEEWKTIADKYATAITATDAKEKFWYNKTSDGTSHNVLTTPKTEANPPEVLTANDNPINLLGNVAELVIDTDDDGNNSFYHCGGNYSSSMSLLKKTGTSIFPNYSYPTVGIRLVSTFTPTTNTAE